MCLSPTQMCYLHAMQRLDGPYMRLQNLMTTIVWCRWWPKTRSILIGTRRSYLTTHLSFWISQGTSGWSSRTKINFNHLKRSVYLFMHLEHISLCTWRFRARNSRAQSVVVILNSKIPRINWGRANKSLLQNRLKTLRIRWEQVSRRHLKKKSQREVEQQQLL